MISLEQTHLNHQDRVNLGSYYTNTNHINQVLDYIKPYIDNSYTFLDSSCGYGNFLFDLKGNKIIGNDIDDTAIIEAKKNVKNGKFFNINALDKVSRDKYSIKKDDKLCIIGNPPYNDRTSIIKHGLKNTSFSIDYDIKTRDLGISFLLSYNKLNSEVVCVLHPLSYLIKKSNFSLLSNFFKNYKLNKAKIISSGSFKQASNSTQFPIVIGLYLKNKNGMSYDNIKEFDFEVGNNLFFKLNSFDYINNYIKKYPNQSATPKKSDIFFWTMRDINALKRNQTFVKKANRSTIIIDKSKLDYYIYVDVFKSFTKHVPYYFGNCDVIIDNKLLQKYKKYFISEVLNRRKYLSKYYFKFNFSKLAFAKQKINEYFQKLLGIHYVD